MSIGIPLTLISNTRMIPTTVIISSYDVSVVIEIFLRLDVPKSENAVAIQDNEGIIIRRARVGQGCYCLTFKFQHVGLGQACNVQNMRNLNIFA